MLNSVQVMAAHALEWQCSGLNECVGARLRFEPCSATYGEALHGVLVSVLFF